MRSRDHVGELRPSQLLHTYGVGATVELPEMTTLVLGLDEWPRVLGKLVSEPRLLAAVRAVAGTQVEQLLTPPVIPEGEPGVVAARGAVALVGHVHQIVVDGDADRLDPT